MHFSAASTRSELCGLTRKRFNKLDSPPDKALTDGMYESCLKSTHPSVYICPREPETSDARKLHRVIKMKLKKIERKEQRKESRKRRGNKDRKRKRKEKNRKLKKKKCRKSKKRKWKNGKCKNRLLRNRRGRGNWQRMSSLRFIKS